MPIPTTGRRLFFLVIGCELPKPESAESAAN